MKITVAGTGYVGLVTGVCLAEKGHEVICVDLNEEKVKLMQKGISPIFEPGLEALMAKNKNRITYTTDYEMAYADADVIFIGVGTPEKKDGSANLKYVYEVAIQIAHTIKKDCVVVVKSTVPIGTNDKVEAMIREHLIHPVNVYVASNPEFLAQGTAVSDTLYASRIVIGAEDELAIMRLKQVYQSFEVPLVIMNRRSAEMVKYAANDFLALKISYINEIANLCELVGANIEDVTKGMGYDERIGKQFLNAGIGYGGPCFPKDTKALHWLASFHDYELKTIKAAIEVNENQKIKLIKKALKQFDSFKGLTVAVLGLTFKPGTDDLREAPSLVNIPILLEDGAVVKVWDSVGTENFKKLYPDEVIYCESIQETLHQADLCFIFTEWNAIKALRPQDFIQYMKHPIIFDGRNCFDVNEMKQQGIQYESIGR